MKSDHENRLRPDLNEIYDNFDQMNYKVQNENSERPKYAYAGYKTPKQQQLTT